MSTLTVLHAETGEGEDCRLRCTGLKSPSPASIPPQGVKSLDHAQTEVNSYDTNNDLFKEDCEFDGFCHPHIVRTVVMLCRSRLQGK